MSDRIRPAQQTDLTQIRKTFIRSFWEDPVVRWLFPDDEDFRDGSMMIDFFRRLIAHGCSSVTPDVVAFALWIPPGRPDVEFETIQTDPPSDELIGKFIALGEAIAVHTPAEDHWYLQTVGTHPDWQRRGYGSLLIEEGIARARRDGLGVYLETETIENVAYYQHLGFEIRSEWDVDAGGPHMWGMWYPRW
ncbi:MAG: GNAT family N-acetyltransferase [Actinomycetota bacterium]